MSSSEHRDFPLGWATLFGAIAVIIAALIGVAFGRSTNSNLSQAAVVVVTATTASNDSNVPQPTYTLLPTSTPYPTLKPNLTVVTPNPFIVTATPSANQQVPQPGSVISAGQSYTRNGVTITLEKRIDTATFWSDGTPMFGFHLRIDNQSGQQIAVLWKNSFIHVKDNTGKSYSQGSAQGSESWNRNKQFTMSDGDYYVIRMDSSAFGDGDQSFAPFIGSINASAQYLIITLDQMVGIQNMNWRYDLQP